MISRKIKTTFTPFLLLFLSLTINPICSRAQPTTPNNASHQFNFGIIIPLSGDLAEYGVAIQNGFKLAEETKPELFKNISFTYEDSRYDGNAAVSALRKLQSFNDIDLYYLWGVSPTEAMLPIAASLNLPVIAETTVKEASVGKPFVIRAARTGERIALALAAELKRRDVQSVSFIVSQIPFYTDIVKHLERILPSMNISVRTLKDVLPSETDFKSYMVDRSSLSKDTVGLFLLPSQMITFYRQAERVKLKLKTFNADILDRQTIIAECPDNINGAFFTQVGVTSDFRERYTTKFDNDIQIGSAAQAYDVGMIVGNLFGKLNNRPSNREIIKKLSELPPQNGATGTFHYSETAEAGKEFRMPVSMKIVRDKKIEILTEDTGY